MTAVVRLHLEDAAHAEALLRLLDHYARDPMGGGRPLSPCVREQLAARLSEQPHYFGFLAFQDGEAVGVVNCFWGFSTFAARPLVNVHDIAVLESHRGLGIGRALLAAVEREAAEAGACKLTLEVLEGNRPARRVYESFGFRGYELDAATGQALFLEKPLG